MHTKFFLLNRKKQFFFCWAVSYTQNTWISSRSGIFLKMIFFIFFFIFLFYKQQPKSLSLIFNIFYTFITHVFILRLNTIFITFANCEIPMKQETTTNNSKKKHTNSTSRQKYKSSEERKNRKRNSNQQQKRVFNFFFKLLWSWRLLYFWCAHNNQSLIK